MNKSIGSLSYCVMFLAMVSTLFPAVELIGQSDRRITGKVQDEETHAALSFASIRISRKGIGTVTNDDGEFEFYISEKYATDTLVISMLGYDSYTKRVTDINLSQNLIIRLKVHPIQLDEVVIAGTKLSAHEIVTKAFESIENNYPMKPYILKGFYRETHQENNRSVILVEAALEIYDKGYKAIQGNRSRLREKVDLKNIRSSKSYRHSLFKNTAVERYNLVISALRCNPLKYRDPNIRKAFANKIFTLDSVIHSNGRQVYVISFLSYIPRYPLFERKNTVYIDSENYSIYKYGWEEYAKKGKYSEPSWPLAKDSMYLSWRKRISTTYEFGNYNGKMFLKYFDEKCYDDIYNSKGDSVTFESLGHVTLIVNEMETDNIPMDGKETMIHNQSLHAQVNAYDPEFWSSYDQIKLVPLTKKQIKDLEWEMPLSEQFLMNGKGDQHLK